VETNFGALARTLCGHHARSVNPGHRLGRLLPRRLIADALKETATRLAGGLGADVRGREARLVLAFAEALKASGQVAEARTTPQWRPEMPSWPAKPPKRLGGFDIAIRFAQDMDYSLVGELKWTHYGIANALDEAPGDAFKLAHAAATLETVTDGLLIYLAPLAAWEKPARFATFFADAFVPTRTLISDYESIWRWCLREGSDAWPTSLPPHLQTCPIGRAEVTFDDAPWQIRAATVVANGEPWIELDAEGMPLPEEEGRTLMDWPYPAPGPGMEADDPADEFRWPTEEPVETPSDDLVVTDVPSPRATWSEIT
jgi:hypothetical protein